MGWGNHHLDAYDPDIGRSRTFTADELQHARGRSVEPGYRFYSVEEAAKMKKKTERQLLERLVDLGNKFRLTPVVDNDFPAQRDNFDACLLEATTYLKNTQRNENGND